MSCYVLATKHFNSIAAFVRWHGEGGELQVYNPETKVCDYMSATQVAGEMEAQNVRSYNTRYRTAEVPAGATFIAVPVPVPAEMAGILRSWGYQSCETADFRETLAFSVERALMELVLEVLGRQAAKADPNPEGKTYEWA